MRRLLCMIAAAAAVVAFAVCAPVGREAAMARASKIREMKNALHLDEAAWEARRYEARKARCNGIADTVRKSLTYPTNAVSFSVDFRTGDIRVEFVDGGAYVQRYVPGKAPVAVHLGKPRKNENQKVILKPDGTLWNPPRRTRPKAK